jgi:hypothetical protein
MTVQQCTGSVCSRFMRLPSTAASHPLAKRPGHGIIITVEAYITGICSCVDRIHGAGVVLRCERHQNNYTERGQQNNDIKAFQAPA